MRRTRGKTGDGIREIWSVRAAASVAAMNAQFPEEEGKGGGGGGGGGGGMAASSSSGAADFKETQVESEALAGSKMRFKVSVNAANVVDTIKETLSDLEKRVQVPGFRPGKPVGEKILLNYIGRDKVFEEAAETVLLRHMKYALREVEGKAIKDTERVVTDGKKILKAMRACYSAATDCLSFEVEVEVAPEVRWRGDYAAMSVDVVIPVTAEAADSSSSESEPPSSAAEARRRTDAIIANRLKELGTMRIVTDRGVEDGDIAVVSTEGYRVNEDGSRGDEILAARQKKFRIDLTGEDLSSYIPGFIENLRYMKAGETKDDIRLTFPDNWAVETLRGTDSLWKIHVDEHFCIEVPQESDDIAAKIQPGMESMDGLRAHLDAIAMEGIVKEEEDMTDDALLRSLSGLMEADIPEGLIQEHGQQLYLQKLIEMQSTGKLSSEQISSLATREMVDNFIVSKRDDIQQSVATTLAVEDVFKCEKMEITREELEEEMKVAKRDFDKNGMQYDEARLEEQAEEVLIGRKVIAFLRDKSEVTKKYTSSVQQRGE